MFASSVARPARQAVTLAVGMIEPGPVRERYRDELLAELAGRSAYDQVVAAVSMLAGAPALHRALVESHAVSFPHAPWWCHLTLRHRWRRVSTADGGLFRRCTACGLDDDETGLGDLTPTSYRVDPQGFGR